MQAALGRHSCLLWSGLFAAGPQSGTLAEKCVIPRGKVSVVNQDIDGVLEGWEHKPGMVQARMVQARSGRQVIKMRVDLGILQMEVARRPDGAGCSHRYADRVKGK